MINKEVNFQHSTNTMRLDYPVLDERDLSSSYNDTVPSPNYYVDDIISTHNINDTGVILDTILSKPRVVYFTPNRDHSGCVEFLAKINFCEFLFCHDWANLSTLLQYQPEYLIVDHHSIVDRGTTVDEFVLMLETMLKYLNYTDTIRIGVVIDKTATLKFIKKLQRVSLIQGIVPRVSDFGEEQALAALSAIVAGVQYWPNHIIDQFAVKKKVHSDSAITLTPRQAEILELISERGISNKQIARILKISESTVKIHVSAIMRAYCVRNRTQLALTSKK